MYVVIYLLISSIISLYVLLSALIIVFVSLFLYALSGLFRVPGFICWVMSLVRSLVISLFAMSSCR